MLGSDSCISERPMLVRLLLLEVLILLLLAMITPDAGHSNCSPYNSKKHTSKLLCGFMCSCSGFKSNQIPWSLKVEQHNRKFYCPICTNNHILILPLSVMPKRDMTKYRRVTNCYSQVKSSRQTQTKAFPMSQKNPYR